MSQITKYHVGFENLKWQTKYVGRIFKNDTVLLKICY